MATNVVMEALSPTMEEGRLVEWKKQEGEPVAVGDVLAEVETDKAVMELVARAGGTLIKQVVSAGTTVPVSQLVAVIGEPGETVSVPAAPSSKGGAGASGPDAQATQPAPDRDRPVSMPPAVPAPQASEPTARGRTPAPAPTPGGNGQPMPSGERVKASPLAKRMAAERGIDLAGISGSGPEGRVVARDLAQAGTGRTAAAGPARPAPTTTFAASTGPAYTDTPLTQIRKTIAKRLSQSIGPIPTFYLTTEVDMERASEAREALLEGAKGAEGAPKVSFNDLVIKATALALRQHPACNAWWQDDRIRYWNEVHISMAVAIEDGLITPVIRHADRKSLREISAEARDLAGRARERRLAPEEYTGGTFSISNLGMLDIDEFTAVINPPEAGILAIGRIVPKPVVHEGTVQARRRMRVTMSCDHRVIDGATGARFLQTLTGMLENPLRMVY
ncbi:MAG TPA: dihydrolipoamide acetyltransferase family protein [Gemmatimonadales bacterium]|nr:dihydrolipoamide acetyltransferase family protein [Gemmatimonadales bacterium]